jgi:hypothetical protein
MNAHRARARGLRRQFYTAEALNQEAIAVLRNEMQKQRVRVFAFNGKPGEPLNAKG